MTHATPVILPSSARSLFPFTSRWTEVNGFKYHYVDEGEGEPVVMIHGNPTWSFYFRSLIKGLSPEYRTIAMDHVGCGLSEKPHRDAYDFKLASRVNDLEAFLRFLDLRRKATLILHDWGGMIGMAYAVERPETIARIVVMNTAAFLPPADKPIPWRLRLIRNFRPFAAPAVLGANLFARAAVIMAASKRLSAPVKQGLLAPYNAPRHRLATLKFVQDIPLGPEDPSYALVRRTEQRLHVLSRVPVLILWGERDWVFDRDYLDGWRRRFPRATVRAFKEAGHYLLEDAPAEALELITDFLEKHP